MSSLPLKRSRLSVGALAIVSEEQNENNDPNSAEGTKASINKTADKAWSPSYGHALRSGAIQYFQDLDNLEATPFGKRRLTKTKVHKLLSEMGVEDPEDTSYCVKAAIAQGFIKLKGEPRELEMVVFRGNGECGHEFSITLRELLVQKEYCVAEDFKTNSEYCCFPSRKEAYDHTQRQKRVNKRERLKGATIFCANKSKQWYKEGEGYTVSDNSESDEEDEEEEDFKCQLGKTFTYIERLCTKVPSHVNDGGFKHCQKCSGFGRCIFYRWKHCDDCGKHYQDADSYLKGQVKGECGCKQDPEKRYSSIVRLLRRSGKPEEYISSAVQSLVEKEKEKKKRRKARQQEREQKRKGGVESSSEDVSSGAESEGTPFL